MSRTLKVTARALLCAPFAVVALILLPFVLYVVLTRNTIDYAVARLGISMGYLGRGRLIYGGRRGRRHIGPDLEERGWCELGNLDYPMLPVLITLWRSLSAT